MDQIKLIFKPRKSNINNLKTYEEIASDEKIGHFSNHKKDKLSDFLSSNHLKEGKNFNKWFNEKFEKYKTETEEQTNGYGEWLKSNEDIALPPVSAPRVQYCIFQLGRAHV